MRANLPSAFAAGAVALLLSTSLASAELLNFSVELSGAAEAPPNDSPGTGMVTADYDTETKLFKWSISYQDLTGPATAAHFHGPANPDENAPPVLPVELEPAAAGAEPATSTEAEPATPTDAEPAMPSEPATPDEPEMPTDVEPEPTTEAEAEGPADAEPAMAAQPATSTEADADADAEVDADADADADAEAEADADGPAEIMPGSPDVPEAANQIAGEATLTDEQAADLRGGKWYFNIHTAQYPDGELRGQLPAYAE